MVRFLVGVLVVAVLAVSCTSSTLNSTAPPGWGQWERFGSEVARLQFYWEIDLRLDTNTDVWPQRLREVCETDLTLDTFGDLGKRFVAADLEAGLDLGATGSSGFLRESNLARQLLWGFALDVCVPEPLTDARDFVMTIWVNLTGLLESPEWPERFEEVCALDPSAVRDYRPLGERYVAEDVAAGLSLAGADFIPPSVAASGSALWMMAVHPEPRDVCPEHALSTQQEAFDESTSRFGTWRLTRYSNGGETTKPIGGSRVSMVVDFSSGFTGFLGCNNYILQFETEAAGDIDVTRFWTTHRLCLEPEGIMAQEELLGSLLSRATSYELTDQGLELTTETGDRLMWSR